MRQRSNCLEVWCRSRTFERLSTWSIHVPLDLKKSFCIPWTWATKLKACTCANKFIDWHISYPAKSFHIPLINIWSNSGHGFVRGRFLSDCLPVATSSSCCFGCIWNFMICVRTFRTETYSSRRTWWPPGHEWKNTVLRMEKRRILRPHVPPAN